MRLRANIAAGRVLACLAVLLACALIPRAVQAQASPAGVFSTFRTGLVPDIGVALEPATMRSRVVQVDMGQVAAARLGQETLTLNLFDDAAVDVQIDRVRPTRSGYFVAGRPEGVEWGEVRLVVNGPVMVGTVVTPDGKYTIRFGGAGRHIIRQVDPSQEVFADDVVANPSPPGPPQAIAAGGPLPPGSQQATAPGDPLPPGVPQATLPGDPADSIARAETEIDQYHPSEDGSQVSVLIVYTPAAQAREGGASGMRALIDLMIETANHTFEISGIDPRLVLAHSALVDYVESDTETDLIRLHDRYDGYMDEVHALRNEYAADLVHLVSASLGFVPGIAHRFEGEDLRWEKWSAFAVTAIDSETTFTHEIGHNFGMLHDRFVDGSEYSIYPYAFGYVNRRAFEPGASASTRWQTIMAYTAECRNAGFSCGPLARFANPDQTFRGDPLGLPADHPVTGSEGPADARLTINTTARWVGSFRSEVCTQFAVSPQRIVAPVAGIEVMLDVLAAPGCLWDASTEAGFLTPETEARQAGPRYLSVSVEPNATGEERVGTVTVAGMTVEFRQLAAEADVCDRTYAVVLAISGDVPCDEIGDGELREITSLSLDGQGLSTLKAGDFEGLANLRSLSLGDNQLAELPEGLFDGLYNLESLELTRNRLTELPARLFADLAKLRQLYLQLNELSDLPDGLFSGLSRLQTLELSQNDLSRISGDDFADLSELATLNLEHNSFTWFSLDTFAGLSSLVSLSLGNNSYATLPSGLFSGLPNLQGLSIGSSRLRRLPEDMFAGLSRLRRLSLQGSPLSDLSPRLFRGLSSLETLIVGHTEMPSLPEAVFSGLTALEHLSLSGNRFDNLPPGIFADLRALRRLNLAGNRLSTLPDGIFSGLTALESLRLEGNAVSPFPFDLILERVGDHQLKAVTPLGAPFEIGLYLTVSRSGEVAGGANFVTIPVGAVESAPLDVTRVNSLADTVTVDILLEPRPPEGHSGYVTVKDVSLPIEIPLPEDISPPSQVTGLEVARGPKSLRVSWNFVNATNGYKVQWKSGDQDYDESRQARIFGATPSYTITGLEVGTEYTVRVLATRYAADDGQPSEEVSATTRFGDPDVNGDGALDEDDAQVMWYSYRYPSLVGDGETGGTEASRQRFLGGYSGLDDPSDEDLRAMVARANTWRTEGLNEGGDINADGVIDDLDARAMYHAYRSASLLGDGEEGGAARFRLQLLGPLAGKADPTDEELKAMLRRANELREAYTA